MHYAFVVLNLIFNYVTKDSQHSGMNNAYVQVLLPIIVLERLGVVI